MLSIYLGRKPFPMAFGDDFDCSIDHFDGGLIVNRVRRHRYPGGPFFLRWPWNCPEASS